MRVGDIIYFAPDYKLFQLLTDSPIGIVNAFKKRIEEYYLSPAELLNKNLKAFGAGVLCFTAIDAIAKYEIGGYSGKRFKEWISKNLQDFKTLKWEYIERIYEEFRNGLIHEGRIKNGGQFTYEISKAVVVTDEVILINPKLLLEQLRTAFNIYMSNVKSNPEKQRNLSEEIKKDFNQDLKMISNES